MLFTRRRRLDHVDIWPGFVDSLASILMIIVFVLMMFFVAQLSLTDALSVRNRDVEGLKEKIRKLNIDFEVEKKEKTDLLTRNTSLKTELDKVNAKLLEIIALRDDLIKKSKDSTEKTTTLEDTLKKLKLSETEALQLKIRLEEELRKAQADKGLLERELNRIGEQQTKYAALEQIGLFRSEFFAKLQKVLGNRNDIRVVGDRFVFQAEVLFKVGSAQLDQEGLLALAKLADTLGSLIDEMPKDVNWVLRVDGHTDQLPIQTSLYPSNWELSVARAVAVVKYLISKDVPANRLVAAGFGEYQPLGEDAPRNRRIEFTIDHRVSKTISK